MADSDSDLFLAMLHFGRWLERHGMNPDDYALKIECRNSLAAYNVDVALKLDFDGGTLMPRGSFDLRRFELAGIKIGVATIGEGMAV